MTIRASLLLTLLLANTVATAQDNPADSPKAFHALCAAAHAVLASQGDGGLLDQVIGSEARRHAAAARRLGATEKDLQQFVEAIRLEYNAGKLAWSEIADLAEACVELQSP